jgi:hypothetical protein
LFRLDTDPADQFAEPRMLRQVARLIFLGRTRQGCGAEFDEARHRLGLGEARAQRRFGARDYRGLCR